VTPRQPEDVASTGAEYQGGRSAIIGTPRGRRPPRRRKREALRAILAGGIVVLGLVFALLLATWK